MVWQVEMQHESYAWYAAPGGEIFGEVSYKFEPNEGVKDHTFQAMEEIAGVQTSWGEYTTGTGKELLSYRTNVCIPVE